MVSTEHKNEINCISKADTVLNCLEFELFVIDQDFKIKFANKAFLRSVGKNLSDVVGQYCYKLSHGLDSPCKPPNDPCPVEEVLKNHKPSVEMHTHLIKDKQVRVNVTAAEIKQDRDETCFLHIDLPMNDKADRKQEAKEALEKTLDVLKVITLYENQINELKEKTRALENTKKELERKIEDLEKFNSITVDRELKMIELKKRIKELEDGI